MHEAKKRGRDTLLVFSAAMHEAAKQRVHQVAELRTALATDQLELEYQPIMDLRTGAIAGAEALIRWRHPALGLLAPDTFLDAADEAGLTVEIGHWVLRNAIAQTGRWKSDPGLPADFSTHINLSPADLHHVDLAPYVEGLLAQHGVEPRHISIEITETAIMRGGPEVAATMQSLNDLGVRIEIDDFGTGYSSISYLRTLPAAQAKIDKSLLDGLTTDRQQEAFVAAILQLIHSAGLGAVAEGIEDREQANRLRQLNCEFGQGYFFSRPLPVADMTDLLAAQRRRRRVSGPVPAGSAKQEHANRKTRALGGRHVSGSRPGLPRSPCTVPAARTGAGMPSGAACPRDPSGNRSSGTPPRAPGTKRSGTTCRRWPARWTPAFR